MPVPKGESDIAVLESIVDVGVQFQLEQQLYFSRGDFLSNEKMHNSKRNVNNGVRIGEYCAPSSDRSRVSGGP
jgi:hypothetical protein